MQDRATHPASGIQSSFDRAPMGTLHAALGGAELFVCPGVVGVRFGRDIKNASRSKNEFPLATLDLVFAFSTCSIYASQLCPPSGRRRPLGHENYGLLAGCRRAWCCPYRRRSSDCSWMSYNGARSGVLDLVTYCFMSCMGWSYFLSFMQSAK